ncbi:MAG: undecaprenyl-diphosphate phosphatase [Solobacterium sp.]|nr:undecaprenyl-diphosphate phosphatase [Solobacterium sp.]
MIFFINVLKSVVLGIVQGATEWLPVSSTFHMALLKPFMTMNVFTEAADNDAFYELFITFIRIGAVIAVFLLYRTKLDYFKTKQKKRKRQILEIWIRIIAASIPVGIAGILLEEWFRKTFSNFIYMACILVILGTCFILLERGRRRVRITSVEAIPYRESFATGVLQTLALIPGTGRSACVILGAKLLGFSKMTAVEFSLYTAIPVVLGAALVRVIKYHAVITMSSFFILLCGSVATFIVSLTVIRMFVAYIRNHDFRIFGLYRIVLGFTVLFMVLVGVLV